MFVKIVFVFLFCISFSLSEYTYKCGDDLKVGLCQLNDYENNIIYVSVSKGKKMYHRSQWVTCQSCLCKKRISTKSWKEMRISL